MKNPGHEIARLRNEGYDVKVVHKRPVASAGVGAVYEGQLLEGFEIRKRGLTVFPRGGLTTVRIKTPDGIDVETSARCRSDGFTIGGNWEQGDSFNRRLGTQIALGRALNTVRRIRLERTAKEDG